MRILDRYLTKGFLLSLSFCLALFGTLFILVDSFNNLDEFLRHGVHFGVILSYYAYSLPSILIQIVPVASLVAILFTLSHLNRHNEIVALKASGISAFHILAPYLFCGVLLSFVIFLLNECVVPKTTVQATSIMEGLILKGKKNMDERAIKNVTLRSVKHRIVFAREMEVLDQTLHDVVVLEENAGNSVKSKLVAKKARYEDHEWVFYDAMKYNLNRLGEMVGEPVYSTRTTIDLPEKPDDFMKEASRTEFMSSKELKETITQFQGQSRKLTRRLWVDFYFRIAFPFASLIVMLIGAPLAIRMDRGNTMVGIGTSLAVVLSYYTMDSICLALGKGGYLPPFFSAWFTNVLFASVGIYLIKNTA